MRANNEIKDANEASFNAALAALGEPARVMPVQDSGSHDQALVQPEPKQFELPHALDTVAADRQIRIDPTLIGKAAAPAPGEDERITATRAALGEATSLWGEGFILTLGMAFKATTKLLRHPVDRLRAYVHSALFRADFRELLTQIKQLKRDALRFQRRLKSEDKAQHELAQAELLLERFDSEHPRPGQLSRQEWMRRRARRLRAVQVRQQAWHQAREATGPQAQQDYTARAQAGAQALEQWSSAMLARYPVDADTAPMPNVVVKPDPDPAQENAGQPKTRGFKFH